MGLTVAASKRQRDRRQRTLASAEPRSLLLPWAARTVEEWVKPFLCLQPPPKDSHQTCANDKVTGTPEPLLLPSFRSRESAAVVTTACPVALR